MSTNDKFDTDYIVLDLLPLSRTAFCSQNCHRCIHAVILAASTPLPLVVVFFCSSSPKSIRLVFCFVVGLFHMIWIIFLFQINGVAILLAHKQFLRLNVCIDFTLNTIVINSNPIVLLRFCFRYKKSIPHRKETECQNPGCNSSFFRISHSNFFIVPVQISRVCPSILIRFTSYFLCLASLSLAGG